MTAAMDDLKSLSQAGLECLHGGRVLIVLLERSTTIWFLNGRVEGWDRAGLCR